jgi:hypothetical protein
VKAGAYLFVRIAKYYLGENVKDKGWYFKNTHKKILTEICRATLKGGEHLAHLA